MPFFYDLNNAVTSNGSANTETDHLRLLTATGSGTETTKIVGLYAGCRFGTAGGAQLRVKTFATASTVGAAATPAKRHPSFPAAKTTAFTGPTAGATPTVRITVGAAQTGGTGGWVALEPNAGITLLPGAGANGNADVFSIAASASVPLDFTVEFSEG